MKARLLFAWIWRVNSVVILAVGVVGLFVLMFAAAVIYKDMTRKREASGVINVTEQEIDAEKVTLGEFREVEGTGILRAPLNLEQEYAFGSVGSKGTDSLQNFLHFDLRTNESYWLIPGYRGLILEAEQIPPRTFDEKERNPVAYAYVLVEKDSNGDGKLTRNDDKSIGVALSTGKNFARLPIKAEYFHGAHLKGESSMVVLYTSEARLHVVELALPSMQVLRDSTIKPQEVEQGVSEDGTRPAGPPRY
jgi:hypothetical protein